jgi:hypothetical protein
LNTDVGLRALNRVVRWDRASVGCTFVGSARRLFNTVIIVRLGAASTIEATEGAKRTDDLSRAEFTSFGAFTTRAFDRIRAAQSGNTRALCRSTLEVMAADRYISKTSGLSRTVLTRATTSAVRAANREDGRAVVSRSTQRRAGNAGTIRALVRVAVGTRGSSRAVLQVNDAGTIRTVEGASSVRSQRRAVKDRVITGAVRAQDWRASGGRRAEKTIVLTRAIRATNAVTTTFGSGQSFTKRTSALTVFAENGTNRANDARKVSVKHQ